MNAYKVLYEIKQEGRYSTTYAFYVFIKKKGGVWRITDDFNGPQIGVSHGSYVCKEYDGAGLSESMAVERYLDDKFRGDTEERFKAAPMDWYAGLIQRKPRANIDGYFASVGYKMK